MDYSKYALVLIQSLSRSIKPLNIQVTSVLQCYLIIICYVGGWTDGLKTGAPIQDIISASRPTDR